MRDSFPTFLLSTLLKPFNIRDVCLKFSLLSGDCCSDYQDVCVESSGTSCVGLCGSYSVEGQCGCDVYCFDIEVRASLIQSILVFDGCYKIEEVVSEFRGVRYIEKLVMKDCLLWSAVVVLIS